jgi:hypothetical protein
MMDSDNDAVLTIKLAMDRSKGKEINTVYWADSWELLAENLDMVDRYK